MIAKKGNMIVKRTKSLLDFKGNKVVDFIESAREVWEKDKTYSYKIRFQFVRENEVGIDQQIILEGAK
jgi:hypothetical protein